MGASRKPARRMRRESEGEDMQSDSYELRLRRFSDTNCVTNDRGALKSKLDDLRPHHRDDNHHHSFTACFTAPAHRPGSVGTTA